VTKILSQAGISLADAYNVVGSVAGIEELVSREVQLTHDMAATLFSERMSSNIVATSTGAISQTTSFDAEITGLPATPFRVHGIMLLNGNTDTIARIANICVVMVSEGGRDLIVWAWDGTVANFRVEGQTDEHLGETLNFGSRLPTLGMGGDQPVTVPQMFMRGTTTTFGAGTVNIASRVHISFSQLEGVSSFGLPIPSW